MLLMANPTLENHLVGLVARDIFGGFSAVNPPADRIKCRKSDGAVKHVMVELWWKRNGIPGITAKISVKEGGAKPAGC